MLSVHEAGQVFVTPSAYTDENYFYEACSVLRDHSPVHYVENERFNSFYAITRHSDVMSVEARNSIFINEPRPVLADKASDQRAAEQGNLLRTLIHVDDPEHRALRGVTSDWFLPKSLQRLESRLEALIAGLSQQNGRDG
jgi:cytochrome P450